MIEGVTTRRTVTATLALLMAAGALVAACDTQPPARPIDAQSDTVASEAPEPAGLDAISQALERVRVAAENTSGSDWDDADWERWTAELEERIRRYREDRDAFMSGEGPDPGEFRIGGGAPPVEGIPVPDSVLARGGADPDSVGGRYIEVPTPPAPTGGLQDSTAISATESTIPPPPPAPEDERTGPVFTPFEVAPELLNRREMEGALRREYPALLRDAGIGGTVTLHFHISEEGEVLETVLARSSGHAALDSAAEEVARVLRFSPARNLDREVAVWVQLNITFGDR